MTHSVSDGKKGRLHPSHKIVQKCRSAALRNIALYVHSSSEGLFRVNKLSFFSEHLRVSFWIEKECDFTWQSD